MYVLICAFDQWGAFNPLYFAAKLLYELILPVETRINDVREFLMAIDHTLTYEIVPIPDPFGPTKTDPNLDVIVHTQIR